MWKTISYTHEEYIHTHTKNTCKQDTYKCSKEHIHTHIENTFILILKSIQNETFRKNKHYREVHRRNKITLNNTFTHIKMKCSTKKF